MKKLTLFSMCLALVVILLGAFTRLTDAGLGCPDWPGCYGFLSVPTAEQVATAEVRFPQRPVDAAKAWAEMIHRYIAASLGLFIVAIAALHWRSGGGSKLPYALVGLVLFQGALGMWTVTLNLMPIIVMGHLLGGFSIVALLWVWWLRQHQLTSPKPRLPLQGIAAIALLVLVGQIALGGWTSANYASLACTQLPICEGDWISKLQPSEAFTPLQPPAKSYEFGVLDHPARMTIHISHRLWAGITTLVLLFLWWRLRQHHAHREATAVGLILALQLALGISNVVAGLPLLVAVAHNGVAALLLLAVVACNVRAWQGETAHG
ncbi:COX15/CtaA family protein [Ferrimonas lipolytica]|uniref:Heme A synthase n=1 Tax=Ferrimonas lipolytica TaxID=2724191 RepID=A0A6H1UJA7_9GAMM|nr:COX15/CtaA family protein [Ferrimonas lipolytica]QIZ78393.1 heme A synthase [Ferrimonas lipolytica]